MDILHGSPKIEALSCWMLVIDTKCVMGTWMENISSNLKRIARREDLISEYLNAWKKIILAMGEIWTRPFSWLSLGLKALGGIQYCHSQARGNIGCLLVPSNPIWAMKNISFIFSHSYNNYSLLTFPSILSYSIRNRHSNQDCR